MTYATLAMLAFWGFSAFAQSDEFSRWERVRTPLKGTPSSIGTYSAGCMFGAVSLDLDGPHHAMMRLSRRRHFAQPTMVSYLNDLSVRAKAARVPLLLIGDVSPPRGGPMRSGHNSHQMGLDADVWLWSPGRRPSRRERESLGAPSFVIDRKKLKKTWGRNQNQLVSLAAQDDRVARIFVSPAIKKHFCTTQPEAPWLYKIRAWWGHDAHMHIRLHCPTEDPSCVAQAPLDPKDPGCGEELAWWFSKEADEEWAEMRRNPKPREFPELPMACKDFPEKT
jgi:penicillin-insensitive murein DD-endopeptidase